MITNEERIAALEDELKGARFAAAKHLETVNLQAKIIARFTAESSQPILSAVVASELPAMIMDMGCNSFHAGSPNHEVRCAYADGYRRAKEEAAELVRAALASAPAAPTDLCPVYSWLSKVSKAERGYTGSAAHHLMNYYEGAESAPPAAPAAPLMTDDEIMDMAEPFHNIGGVQFDEVAFARAVLASMSADAQSKGGA